MTSPYAPPAASPDPPAPPAQPRTGAPSPALAMLLSFCAVGVGHAYAGRFKRGFLWALAPASYGLVFAVVARFARGGVLPAALFLMFVVCGVAWAGAVIDAGRMASQARGPRASVATVVLAWLLFHGVTIGLALATRFFFIEAYKIPSGSMIPSLLVGDHIFISKAGWDTRRGDVIVFPFPEKPEQDFVKRVVAIPGDQVAFEKGHTILNGKPVPSCAVGEWSYVEESASPDKHVGEIVVEVLDQRPYLTFLDHGAWSPTETQGPWTVKSGEVFVVGDNRNNAHDSRMWFGGQGGGVPIATVRGAALVVWLSVSDEGVDGDRAGISLDRPHLPSTAAALQPALDACLQKLGVR